MVRGLLVATGLAALTFLPWLGSTGLWDPWEPHYAEVAREMLARGDFVHPYWESAWFFSKPVLLMWLTAAGMALSGAQTSSLPAGADLAGPTPSGLSTLTEWAVRLPVALLAVLAVAVIYLAVARLVSRRAGLLAALATTTAPFYALMARQATTDMPFVALSTCGTLCFAVALMDRKAHRTAWAYAGYLSLAFATLAKGLLGFGLAGAAFLAWFAATGAWSRLDRLRLAEKVRGRWLPVGPLLFLAVAAPWYLALSLFRGVDDEGKTFAYRFWIHDHFKRLEVGVHTTTPGGTFDYFIEQLGYGLAAWVAALPGALGELLRARVREEDGRTPRDELAVLCGLWAVIAYVLMSLSATKFHHYIFPAVPPLAILCALFLDRLWEEEPARHLPALLLGLAALAVVGHSLAEEPKHLVDLFVYNYERPYPEAELAAAHPGHALGPFLFSFGARAVLRTLLVAGGLAGALAYLWRSRRGLVGAFAATALALGLYLSWIHWRELSPHWSQRDVFRTYLAQRRGPDEPIAAYYMNWRGETFYSRNLVRQIQEPQKLKDFAARPGRKWVIVERARLPAMRGVLGEQRPVRIADRSDNKFYLVEITN
jgi:4-amino-4-deoxy-L-arabinose transferase-like glycosyltransferase